ncbi:hypothetical protein DFA_01858 [Cavenderia fasciculata]|uniref:RCR-type E3 ubiquitin transferase n=1 Tax=Cavenderia fasciculata TaxID=261658 RepID=F4PV64_CACFS|nr:uncharacterized protein DFA_01858 [Cavenderia fasciculata]EGG21972.1 hypothetical protein DFA_01858 [Cavenderia fasciculata]|eukprot:XP_004359823.1 hypothetical protein DFA_01858 [Cavenderia fasciculata]
MTLDLVTYIIYQVALVGVYLVTAACLIDRIRREVRPPNTKQDIEFVPLGSIINSEVDEEIEDGHRHAPQLPLQPRVNRGALWVLVMQLVSLLFRLASHLYLIPSQLKGEILVQGGNLTYSILLVCGTLPIFMYWGAKLAVWSAFAAASVIVNDPVAWLQRKGQFTTFLVLMVAVVPMCSWLQLNALYVFGIMTIVIHHCFSMAMKRLPSRIAHQEDADQMILEDASIDITVIQLCVVASYIRSNTFPLPRTVYEQMTNTTIRFVIEMFQLYYKTEREMNPSVDQIQCPGCALAFEVNVFGDHFNACFKEDEVMTTTTTSHIPKETVTPMSYSASRHIDVDDDDEEGDSIMYEQQRDNQSTSTTNTTTAAAAATLSSPFQMLHRTNQSNNPNHLTNYTSANNTTSSSSTTSTSTSASSTPPNNNQGFFGQYIRGIGENVMNPKKLLEDLFKQDLLNIHSSNNNNINTNNTTTNNSSNGISTSNNSTPTQTTKNSLESSFVNNNNNNNNNNGSGNNPFNNNNINGIPPFNPFSTSTTSTTSTSSTNNGNPFNQEMNASNHSFYDLEDHHNYYIEEDEEFKSLQFARKLIEDERRAQLVEEEENNRRLVLELLENEREEHEKSRQQQQTNNDLETKCVKCQKQLAVESLIFLDQCGHIYCKECLHQSIMKKIEMKKVSMIKCKSCKASLSSPDIKQVLSDQEYAKYDSASLDEVISTNKDSFFKCPNCSVLMEKLQHNQNTPQDNNAKEYDQNGNELSRQAIEHKKLYRFRCLQCTTVFCSECFEKPYHLGYTCDQFKNYSTSKHCRYCLQSLKPSNCSTLSNQCCNQPECMQKYMLSCKKKLACGHNCCGISGETKCPPCLVDDCPYANQTQKSSDYCNICWVEELGSSPCIQLECGHIVHLECCKKKLAGKWNSSRISFGFMKCAICPKYIKHPALKKELTEIMDLYNVIKEKGLQRLKSQGPEKGVNLKDPSCRWYNDEEGYVMDRLSFFPCFKCKKPYFGGEKACGENNVDFKPEELLCGGCSCDGADNCKTHGKEYIEYKCKFCCNMSVFFCWGKTHFCNSCHSQSTTIVKTPKDQLPKCSCGVPHPPNGEEHSFGCSLCRINHT